ncbi:MAG: hypothetical protein AB9861_04860 [Methanosarcina sp.]|jgi:hypothetical protein
MINPGIIMLEKSEMIKELLAGLKPNNIRDSAGKKRRILHHVFIFSRFFVLFMLMPALHSKVTSGNLAVGFLQYTTCEY